MADEPNNDDQWLYGDSLGDSQDANNEASEEKKLEKLTSGGDTHASVVKELLVYVLKINPR